jgi:hypothetical protein
MKITLYFYHEQWTYDIEGKISAYSFEMPEDVTGPRLRLFMGAHEVDVPDIDLLPESEIKHVMVKGLRKQKEELQAETHVKLQKIDDQIQQLLCIEAKP